MFGAYLSKHFPVAIFIRREVSPPQFVSQLVCMSHLAGGG